MKNTKFLLSLVASTLTFAAAQANTVTISSYKLKAYELWASTATDCSSPVKVIDNGSSGKEVDIATSTDFGEGNLPPDGTYKCLIAVIGDTSTMVPEVTGTTTSGATQNDACVAGTTYTQDTCAAGTTSKLPDGTTTTCRTGQEDKVAAYISTTGTEGADGHDASTAKLLNDSIVVAGKAVDKTLYVTNPDGLVNQNGSCGQDSNAVLGVR
ncbi:MAG: hypothetical protein JST16_13230 [Bdellovibrionales bacterium]|nr:hypothetical protein [Bdellovibrionales bacterium]